MSNAEYLSDSGSLTPPLADIEKQWQEFGVADDIINIDTEFSPKRQKTGEFDGEKFTPFFNCCHTISKKSGKKQSTTNLRGGYIEPGLLSRLLQNEEPKDNLLEKPIIKLFDYQFITATALVEQRQKLFYFLRQKMFEFESQETDQGLSSYIPQTGDNCWFYTSIRKQCCSFLLYVSAFVHRNLSPLTILAETNDPYLESWNSFPASLRKDVNNLWLFIGAVSSLPNGSFLKLDGASSNIKLSPAGQWLHLHLELKWGLTEILWRLYCVQDEKCVDQLTEIEEKLSALLKDLLHTATHINNGSIPSTLLHTTPFLCPCVKELWVIMIHFLDFLSDSHDIKSFWSALTTILNELLQGDKDQIKNFSFDVSEVCCKDPMLFCWWLLVHIAPLYWYNVEGEYVFKEKGNVSGNGILVQDLLRLAFLSRDAPKYGEGFDILVPLCGDRELQILLSFTQAMMIIISNELQDESRSSSELAQSLWDHVFPHIRQRITDPAVTQAHLNQLTNLAVGFTLLSITVPPESSPQTLETFHNLIRDFGLKDSMTASVSCKFLATLLASPEALEIIQSNDCQTEIVHTWFRCSLQKSSQDQHLLNLTRIVFLKIPETGNIIKTQRSVVAGNVEAALVALIRSLGESFSSLKLLADTVVFREKALVLIGDFLKYIESFLKQGGPPDCLRLSYKVAASLVRDCAKIIYKKTQHDCLLPKIIDQLVLPLNTKKPRSPAITQCIKLNLAEFLEGLASLDFRRDEFIKRKIKQIFAAYFHVFNQKCYLSTNSSPIKNPFLDVLKGTLSANPTQDSSGFRQYVINIIKYNYLVIPGRSPQELIPTLFFLGDLFKRTLSPGETARNTPLILKNILACLLACDTSSPDTEPPYIRSEATKVLELMMISCQKAQEVTS
ncbi:Hypothetical predicted protein, partial [Paramuricea clavata]